MTITQIFEALGRAAKGDVVQLCLSADFYAPSAIDAAIHAVGDGSASIVERHADLVVLQISGSADELLNNLLLASVRAGCDVR